jgi:hypothetical protein
MLDLFRSRLAQILVAAVALLVFYAAGVIVRQHSGVCVIIRNESNEPVRELSVMDESQGGGHNLKDLGRGDDERVFVKTAENSRILLEFDEAGKKMHAVAVFDHARPGDCGTATVRLLPRRNTESVEAHRSVSWNGWFDFL